MKEVVSSSDLIGENKKWDWGMQRKQCKPSFPLFVLTSVLPSIYKDAGPHDHPDHPISTPLDPYIVGKTANSLI